MISFANYLPTFNWQWSRFICFKNRLFSTFSHSLIIPPFSLSITIFFLCIILFLLPLLFVLFIPFCLFHFSFLHLSSSVETNLSPSFSLFFPFCHYLFSGRVFLPFSKTTSETRFWLHARLVYNISLHFTQATRLKARFLFLLIFLPSYQNSVSFILLRTSLCQFLSLDSLFLPRWEETKAFWPWLWILECYGAKVGLREIYLGWSLFLNGWNGPSFFYFPDRYLSMVCDPECRVGALGFRWFIVGFLKVLLCYGVMRGILKMCIDR